jgi:hypothetical protein
VAAEQACSRARERGDSGTVVADMTRREAAHFGTRRLSVPRWRGGCAEAPHGGKACATWQKGHAGARGWLSHTTQGGLGGGLGDACAQEPTGSAVRVPWRQALGHGIAASVVVACCGMRQRHSDAQQHDGMAQSAIGGRQRGDATGRHEAALAGRSRRGLAGITPAGGSVGAEEGDRFGRVSGAVAGRA